MKKLYSFQSLKEVAVPSWLRVLAKVLAAFVLFALVLLSVTPWQQTSQGEGKLIAFEPNDRVQNITSNVPGRVNKWFVRDGSEIKSGDPIVEIVDNDPLLISRLRLERDAVFRRYEAAKAASETAYLDYQRQSQLFKQGLSARTKFEKAKIEYKKLLASEASAAASLAKAEVKLSRQQNQLITAPRDGTILRVLHGSGSVFIKEGDTLAVFVPQTSQPAAEIYVSGNDLPLVSPGRKVRLQFEGWPAIQFSGWPSLAVGTFGGVVSVVDPSVSRNGKFRVIVTPEQREDWPEAIFLRQGTRVYGWILLSTVKLGYELWRQFNGFPLSLNQKPESLDKAKTTDKATKEDEYPELYPEK